MNTNLLKTRIQGSVLEKTSPEYEAVRTSLMWNQLKAARYPEAIVRAASEDDVVEAVRFAREERIKVAIRGGGHSFCGSSLRQGGLLLDLSGLNRVEIDAAGRTAQVQPVVANGEFARRLAAHDLAFPVGHCASVPLSGFLLNGGFGWNAGAWGVSCWSVLEIDAVTADGRLITATDAENADLLWAARGAGPGFFGAVTKFKVKLQKLPQAIMTSTLIYPMEASINVVQWLAENAARLPRNVETSVLLMKAPPALADRKHERICVLSAAVFADSREEALNALSAFGDAPAGSCLAKDLNVPSSFDSLFEMMDTFFPAGERYAADTFWSSSPAPEVMNRIQAHYPAAPSQQSAVMFLVLPPPPADAPAPPDSCFSMAAPVFVGCYSIWSSGQDDAANIAWLRTMMTAMEPVFVGHYVGESDLVACPARSTNSYAAPQWEKLQMLKQKYDPDGLFYSYPGMN